MEDNWVNIFESDDLFLIETAKEILEENKIELFIIDKRDTNFLYGLTEIRVQLQDKDKSLNLISDLKSE